MEKSQRVFYGMACILASLFATTRIVHLLAHDTQTILMTRSVLWAMYIAFPTSFVVVAWRSRKVPVGTMLLTCIPLIVYMVSIFGFSGKYLIGLASLFGALLGCYVLARSLRATRKQTPV